MVIPPITVEQAVQQFLDVTNKPASSPPQQPSRTFGEEVMRHMGGSGGTITAQQSLILSQQSARPQTFLPLTNEGSAVAGGSSTTSARKTNKHKKASAAYSSAPQGFMFRK